MAEVNGIGKVLNQFVQKISGHTEDYRPEVAPGNAGQIVVNDQEQSPGLSIDEKGVEDICRRLNGNPDIYNLV